MKPGSRPPRAQEGDDEAREPGSPAPRALIVEDDEAAREELRTLLEADGFAVETATTIAAARAALAAGFPSLALLDLELPDGSGLEIFREMREAPTVEAVLVARDEDVDAAVESLHLGTFEYVSKPIRTAQVRRVLGNVERTLRFRGEIGMLRQELRRLGRFGRLVGVSPPMQKVYDMLTRIGSTEASVLLAGESGTGKELCALTLHDLSPRRDKPFLAVNCGAVASNMIESELFGHEKGSFTGAVQTHLGFFERANGGTLLLDEISEMAPELQVKLLRVLETGTFVRIGGERDIHVDVRVIAATNRPPELAVREGKLREDLYYRLRVVQIGLPPLRERGCDILLLAEEFLRERNSEGSTAKVFTEEAKRRLEAHPWPGNVRELRNAVHEAFILADTEIGERHLSFLPGVRWTPPVPMVMAGPVSAPVVHSPAASPTNGEMRFVIGEITLEEAERRLIEGTIAKCGGNKTQAARLLGISPKTIHNRLRAFAEASGKVSSPAQEHSPEE